MEDATNSNGQAAAGPDNAGVAKPITTYIYALCEPETGEVRYIGKTDDPRRRHRKHVNSARSGDRTRQCAWIRDLLARGQRPEMRILRECKGDGRAEEIEEIAEHLASGVDLLNRNQRFALREKASPVITKHHERLRVFLSSVAGRANASGRLVLHSAPNGDCLVWRGAVSTGGYPILTIRRKSFYAHRIQYIVNHGWIGPEVVVRHTCDNPLCIRPDHLIPGTHADNVADKVHRGRQPVGSRNGRSKLTEDQVEEIRRRVALGESYRAIGRQFGVDHGSVRQIAIGKTWTSSRLPTYGEVRTPVPVPVGEAGAAGAA
jgi:hypothetical protein